jgi:hypothetical protein
MIIVMARQYVKEVLDVMEADATEVDPKVQGSLLSSA